MRADATHAASTPTGVATSMSGARRVASLRFQPWIVASATGLILVVTLLLALIVRTGAQQFVEDQATQRFESISQRVTLLFGQMIRESEAMAQTFSSADASLLRDPSGAIRGQAQLPTWAAALQVSPTVYGVYYGLNNDDFLQMVAIRGDARIREAVKAPEQAAFAVRRVVADKASETGRTEYWTYLDTNLSPVGERRAASKYQPTERTWFKQAQSAWDLTITAPYTFSSTGKPGLTVAIPLRAGEGIFGVDLQLSSLETFLEKLNTSANAAVVVMDAEGRVLAWAGKGERYQGLDIKPLTPLQEVGNPYLREVAVAGTTLPDDVTTTLEIDGETFAVADHKVEPVKGRVYRVMSFAPISDFSGGVARTRNRMLMATLLTIVVLVPLAWLATRRVSRALKALAQNSRHIQEFDFSTAPQTVASQLYEVDLLGQAQQTMFESLKQRTESLQRAQAKLAGLVNIGVQLGREQDREALLQQALFGARDIANCQAATLYIKTERNTLRFALRTSSDPLPLFELPLYEADGVTPVHRFVASHVALSGETVVIDDIYAETRFDLSGTKQFSEESGMRVVSTLNVPLSPHEGQVIGVIQLMNAIDPSTGDLVPFDPEVVGFVEALAAQAAVAIENQNLLDAQKALMDSMIQIIAGAIDTKSPYTGGHCERVPELAIMLAERASEVHEGPLADFAFQTDDEWREFRIGAWLHDCGKVTTPEYVVDKATKLETIYNRIHEVRMRFEVLLRDAAIERLEAIHERGMDRAAADAAFEARKAQLIDDFAFVAECNLGGEFMAPQRLERLKAIAQQVWMRHFDDRLGLSHEEMKRVEREPAAALPAPEGLLSDKPRHLFERPPTEALDARYGFKLKVPEHLYNHGEVYNLSIGRGTLTEEERFKINEHIIQTIVMLERMPLPANLKRVPEYAGTHHETLEGTGYPRKLKAEDLSIPSRIMAIADIFEALTASDRPYKKAKTLSESIRILHQFKRERHIDPVLFDLFLSSGVYKAYADRYLLPEQVDEVDIRPYLEPATLAALGDRVVAPEQRLRVAVVEDDGASAEFLRHYLAEAGFTVYTADNGLEGVQLVRQRRPDLVIMDLEMPVLNGLEALRQLKDDPGTARIPVIALTGYDTADFRAQAEALGVAAFYGKPVEPPVLIERLRTLCGAEAVAPPTGIEPVSSA